MPFFDPEPGREIFVDSSNVEKSFTVITLHCASKEIYSVYPDERFSNKSFHIKVKKEWDDNEDFVNNCSNLDVSTLVSCEATKEFENCSELINSEFSSHGNRNFERVDNSENDTALPSEPAFMESGWASLGKLDIPVVSLNPVRKEVLSTDLEVNESRYIESSVHGISVSHAKKNIDPTTLVDYSRQFLLFGYYHCNYCSYDSKHKYSLRKHIESIHLNKRLFKCQLCKFRANYSSNLTAHINAVHNGIKPFSCPHCVFSATRQHRLNFHISSVHEKNKPFTCPQCPFATSRRDYINKHIITVHKKIKAFSCPNCKSSFSQRSSLQQHISVVHSKIRRYSCPHCEYMAKRKDYIDKHISSIHEGQKPFSCSLCKYTTSRKEFLKRHISSMHN